jgi:hypothetical protein
MGGEWAWCAPFGKTARAAALHAGAARADIAAVKAIREDFPDARMVHIDPLIWVVPPRDRPDLAEAAHRESYEDAYIAWDVISGSSIPNMAAAPRSIDILGFNNYSFGQMEYRAAGPHQPLEPGDDRIRPLCDLIEEGWESTSGRASSPRRRAARRPAGLAERRRLRSLAAVNRGVDLHGICLFPAVDMTDWHTGEWLHMGIADVEPLPTAR